MNKQKKCVVLGVTGSIAAYKAADIVSQLSKLNIDIHVIMTKSATKFVAPLTFEALSKNPVVTSMFSKYQGDWEIEHISLAKKADLFVVAPASANFIGKFANGIADDMLLSTAMATQAKILIAPAMNSAMYNSFANQNNIKILTQNNCEFVEPQTGLLACNDVGIGKLADTNIIINKILELLNPKQDLLNKNILVTAGPTRENIDPVRYISNRSSGKMGIEIAKAAQNRGANVTLICGPIANNLLANLNNNKNNKIKIIKVLSTQEMFEKVKLNYLIQDIIIKAAAPADFTPEEYSENKIKKLNNINTNILKLKKTQDILHYIGQKKAEKKLDMFLCGFAAESDGENIENYALKKLTEKNLNMIVVNNIAQEGAGFDLDTNIVTLYFKNNNKNNISPKKLELMHKTQVAHKILDEISSKI